MNVNISMFDLKDIKKLNGMECSENKKYSIFMTIYRTHKDFYDSEYHIEQEDDELKEKEYQRNVKEDNFNRLQKLYNRNRK